MDGLDEFEKQLAEEKKAREKSEKGGRDREHKHRHRHRSKHHSKDDDRESRRSKHKYDDDDSKRDERSSKRSRRSEEREERPKKHEKTSDPHEDLPLIDDEAPSRTPKLERDSWMTAPSAMDVDYTQRGAKKVVKLPPSKPDYDLKIHKNELNIHLQELADGKKLEDLGTEGQEVDYTFGDAGAQWRMTKLKAVYTTAEQSGKAVDEIAIERFGSLKEFDDAREEETELERRRLYGKGYIGKEKPSGELFQGRKLDLGIRRNHNSTGEEKELPQGEIFEEKSPQTVSIQVDATTLNRMKAQLMKAKLKKSPDVAKLEAEYNEAMACFSNPTDPGVIVLGKMDNRLLAGTRAEAKSIDNKRGRERGLVEDNEDMTIEDMVREERRTRGQAGGEGMKAAERIAKDAKFDTDLDYMDENANKLAKRVQKSETNLKNAAIECDDDEWEEIRNFMKCLTRMYHDQGRDVVFYENAAAPQRKMHAAMQVVPLPYSLGETAPAFFKEAILSSDEEWTQHKKLIDTLSASKSGLGKQAFRRSIAKEMPYFHAWFELDGGLGHVVEDSNRWPRGDLFAREIIGGMLDIEPDVVKRQGRWTRGDKRVEGFRRRWKKFDWTRVLTDG